MCVTISYSSGISVEDVHAAKNNSWEASPWQPRLALHCARKFFCFISTANNSRLIFFFFYICFCFHSHLPWAMVYGLKLITNFIDFRCSGVKKVYVKRARKFEFVFASFPHQLGLVLRIFDEGSSSFNHMYNMTCYMCALHYEEGKSG